MVNSMVFSDYFFLSIFYYLAGSTALSIGIGYYTIYRPILAGMITGYILNDVQTGMFTGAVVNIIYINFVSTGGSFKGDQCLTAIMAAIFAVVYNLHPIEAAALAFPFGFLGILIWKYRLKINNLFVYFYEEKYKANKNPNISVYNGILPQILLYIMSVLVLMIALNFMFILNKIDYNNIETFLYHMGLILVIYSTFNVLFNINNKYCFIIFAFLFVLNFIFTIKSYYVFIVIMVVLLFIANKKISFRTSTNTGIIKKRDLIYSWFIWMNFSHACYNYERLMGMAFGHSMKNILKKLYKEKDDLSNLAEAIYNHTEFFNTEPNIGTPIHGYIISLEEKRRVINQSYENMEISYIKKGMMGIAAGLGDSFTQAVLTPLFVSMSIMLCLDKNYYMSLMPMIILSLSIIFLSFTGFMNGYFKGKESMIERLKYIKHSKIKLYFPFLFSGVLGISISKLILYNNPSNNIITLIIILVFIFIFVRKRGER